MAGNDEDDAWTTDPAVQLTDYLFLGSAVASECREKLKECGVTAVLNVANDIECHFPDDFEYLHLQVEDGGLDDAIIPAFDKAIDFAKQTKAKRGKVLVHCFMGINRSAVCACAILVKLEGMSLAEAYEHVTQCRPQVSPFQGNKEKIAMWEHRVTGICSRPDWLPAATAAGTGT